MGISGMRGMKVSAKIINIKRTKRWRKANVWWRFLAENGGWRRLEKGVKNRGGVKSEGASAAGRPSRQNVVLTAGKRSGPPSEGVAGQTVKSVIAAIRRKILIANRAGMA